MLVLVVFLPFSFMFMLFTGVFSCFTSGLEILDTAAKHLPFINRQDFGSCSLAGFVGISRLYLLGVQVVVRSGMSRVPWSRLSGNTRLCYTLSDDRMNGASLIMLLCSYI
jgi:hypothetical protein